MRRFPGFTPQSASTNSTAGTNTSTWTTWWATSRWWAEMASCLALRMTNRLVMRVVV